MKKLIYNILDKSLIIIAILLGVAILAIWILPLFAPFLWQSKAEMPDEYYDSITDEDWDRYYDDWPPH